MSVEHIQEVQSQVAVFLGSVQHHRSPFNTRTQIQHSNQPKSVTKNKRKLDIPELDLREPTQALDFGESIQQITAPVLELCFRPNQSNTQRRFKLLATDITHNIGIGSKPFLPGWRHCFLLHQLT